MKSKEKKKIVSAIKKKLRYVVMDMYGITLYEKKPKLHKKYQRKKTNGDFFAFYDCVSGDEVDLDVEEFDFYKSLLDKEIKQNPKLYRIKLEVELIE